MSPPLRRLAFAALSLGPALCASAAYTPVSVFVPDTEIGMASEYSSLLPQWGADKATLQVPASTTNETNLVWTFWGHTRFDPAEWPQGPGARVSITLVSESAITVRVSSFVRAGNWSAPSASHAITLPAGKPVTVLVPLPSAPSEPVETLRVLLVANENIPALTVTAWSVGNDSTLASASASVSASASPAAAR